MAGKKLLFLAITALLLPGFKAAEEEENFAVELSLENFDEAIAKNNYFVRFFAPWDGYSRKLNPVWKELAKTMNSEDKPHVIIADVDCTQHEMLCHKCKIRGYPRLLFFKLDEKPVDYDGDRDISTLKEFIEEMLKENCKYFLPVIVEGKPVVLDENSFPKYVSKGKHFVYIYNVNAKKKTDKFDPTWDQLAKTLENESTISIDKISSNKIIHNDIDDRKQIELFWFEDGKKIAEYSGPLTHNDLEDYVRDMLKDNENQKKVQVHQLTIDNFEQAIANGVTFVNFYATPCRKCEKENSIWKQLAERIHSSNKEIQIADVNCYNEENKQLCADQAIEYHPTLIVYKNGKRQAEYGLSLLELVEYITQLNGVLMHQEL